MNIKKSISVLMFLASVKSFSAYEAHEWGTFTSLVGSNGVTQNGMYHEDEKLPDFVHGFGKTRADILNPPFTPFPPPSFPCRGKMCFEDFVLERNSITQKMETPVIYFYGDKAEKVLVDVRFPEGVITDTYPAPLFTFPKSRSTPVIGNGHTLFDIEIIPELSGDIPSVEPGNIYSHARNVNSNIIRSGSESEKFIFYRGLGRYQPRFNISSNKGALKIQTDQINKPQFLILLNVNEKGEVYGLVPHFDPKSFQYFGLTKEFLQDLRSDTPLMNREVMDYPLIRKSLVLALEKAGLKNDEAVAMLDTWEHGYFKVPGLRILSILPRNEVDQILPIQFTPAPTKLERVFIARIEVMLDTDEKAILEKITSLRDSFEVKTLGRFAESMMRRVEETYTGNDLQLKELLRKLIDQASKLEFMQE